MVHINGSKQVCDPMLSMMSMPSQSKDTIGELFQDLPTRSPLHVLAWSRLEGIIYKENGIFSRQSCMASYGYYKRT